MVMRARFAAKQVHVVGPQRRRLVQRHVITESLADGDVYSQFFGQLPGQRGRLGFAVSDLPAGQLPAPRQLGRAIALRHQYRLPSEDGPGDDDLGRHGQ